MHALNETSVPGIVCHRERPHDEEVRRTGVVCGVKEGGEVAVRIGRHGKRLIDTTRDSMVRRKHL